MPDYGNNMASDEYKRLAAESAKKAAHARKAGNIKSAKEHEADSIWYMNEHNKRRKQINSE